MPYISERNKASCEGCSDIIDVTGGGTAQHISGWAVNRTGGGTHAVALQQRHPRWLCQFCLDKRRAGLSVTQDTLI